MAGAAARFSSSPGCCRWSWTIAQHLEMSAEHKSPGAAEHLLLQRSQQHCRVWHSSSSSALGSSSPPRPLRLCRTCRKRGPGWGGKSPPGKPVLFTQGPQGSNFVIKGKSHPWHLQSPSNRCVSCRDTFAVEIWFGLELNQCEERAGSNALHKFPASRVPCRAMPAPHGSVSSLLGPPVSAEELLFHLPE